ncbi:MAG: hypothetical protein ACYDDU_19280 [Dermatophilaceae bacterium]
MQPATRPPAGRQFKALAVAIRRRLQAMPKIVLGFFAGPSLTYFVKAA